MGTSEDLFPLTVFFGVCGPFHDERLPSSALAAAESRCTVRMHDELLLPVAGGHIIWPIIASFVLVKCIIIVSACVRGVRALIRSDNAGSVARPACSQRAGCGAIISVQQALQCLRRITAACLLLLSPSSMAMSVP